MTPTALPDHGPNRAVAAAAAARLRRLTRVFWLPLLLGAVALTGQAQENPASPAPGVDLRGNLPAPRRLDIAELRQLPRAEARTTDHRDPTREVRYAGVPLGEVLRAGGLALDPGMASIRKTVAGSVLIEAADGYRAVFALAELNPALTDRIILLADSRDSQPLNPNEGPLRLIVPGEKLPARWVRQVVAITVLTARE